MLYPLSYGGMIVYEYLIKHSRSAGSRIPDGGQEDTATGPSLAIPLCGNRKEAKV